MTMMLEARDLYCERDERTLFRGLSFTVDAGEWVQVTGGNGAGKTTLLRLLTGLARPDGGEVYWQGEPLRRVRDSFHRSLLWIGHQPGIKTRLTARENLRIYTTLLGLPEKNIDEALKIVRLDRQEGKRLSAYSLGMKQRFGIASAMLGFPKLLILDEPTNGLDPSGIQEMRELIRSLPERCGMTVIISSHILSEIDRIVDDIGIIANGELRYQGELERLHEIDEGKTLEEIFLDMTGKDLSL